MLKKLSVIFLSVILIIGILPQEAMAAPRSLGKDDAYYLRLGVRLDERPDNTELLGDFIAENTETGVKYKLDCTGEVGTNAGIEYMYYVAKNLPVGVYDVYAEDDIHTIYRFDGIDFNSIDGPGYENTWGIITSARMFTVEFRDAMNNQVIFTQYVHYNHNASYKGEVPTKPGFKFSNWRSDRGDHGDLNELWYINDTSSKIIYANWTSSPTYTASLNITVNGEELTEGADEAAQSIGNFSLRDADDPTRIISLKRESGLTYTAENVPNGRYNILRNNEPVRDTGIVLEINDADGEAELTFYSVHFMDGDNELSVSYEEPGAKMPAPITPPVKAGYVFDKWTDSKDGKTAFDFERSVTGQTFIYASYIPDHIHDWSDEYEYDDDNHWHECGASDCPITDNSRKDGFGAHTYGEWTVTKQPTVSEYGEKERRCTECGKKETAPVDKLTEGHTHDYTGKQEIVKEPSCTEEGVKRIYCALEDCGSYIEEKIEKTAHDFDTSEWEYDSEGHWHICANCRTADEKTAHRMSEEPVITPPDGNTPGVKTWICGDCGYIRTETIPVTPPEEKPTEPEKPTKPTEPEPDDKPDKPAEPDKFPATGDTARVQIYATLAMIAGMLYLLLYFADGSIGMTEEEKNKLVSRLIGWARGRNIIARYLVIAAVFMVLLAYHSIGRKVEADLSEVRK